MKHGDVQDRNDDDVGARPGESMRAYCARLVACPKCGAARSIPCRTKSGRNHTERLWGPNGSAIRELELMQAGTVVATVKRATFGTRK